MPEELLLIYDTLEVVEKSDKIIETPLSNNGKHIELSVWLNQIKKISLSYSNNKNKDELMVCFSVKLISNTFISLKSLGFFSL